MGNFDITEPLQGESLILYRVFSFEKVFYLTGRFSLLIVIYLLLRPPHLGRKMMVKEDRKAVKVAVWMVNIIV